MNLVSYILNLSVQSLRIINVLFGRFYFMTTDVVGAGVGPCKKIICVKILPLESLDQCGLPGHCCFSSVCYKMRTPDIFPFSRLD